MGSLFGYGTYYLEYPKRVPNFENHPEAAGKTETKGCNEASKDPASGVDHVSQGFGLRDYYDY